MNQWSHKVQHHKVLGHKVQELTKHETLMKFVCPNYYVVKPEAVIFSDSTKYVFSKLPQSSEENPYAEISFK